MIQNGKNNGEYYINYSTKETKTLCWLERQVATSAGRLRQIRHHKRGTAKVMAYRSPLGKSAESGNQPSLVNQIVKVKSILLIALNN